MTPTDHPGWGGPREGSGRPKKGAEHRRQFPVWLEPALADWALQYAKDQGISRSELVAQAFEAIRVGRSRTGQEPPVAKRDEAPGLPPALAEAVAGGPRAAKLGRGFRAAKVSFPAATLERAHDLARHHAVDPDTAIAWLMGIGLMALDTVAGPAVEGD